MSCHRHQRWLPADKGDRSWLRKRSSRAKGVGTSRTLRCVHFTSTANNMLILTAPTIVQALDASVQLPISVKIRLCTPASDTVKLARQLQRAGASLLTLHARYPSARRRRSGPAHLDYVTQLAAELDIPVLSNGNVRSVRDVMDNLHTTGAAGCMVGEELLRNP